MTSISEISTFELTSAGPLIVGAVLLWTGMIKAVAPGTFHRHVASLDVLPGALLSPAVTVAASLETGLGAALIVGLVPGITLPASIAMLIVLSAVSWWGVDTGKAVDCGCYGGFVQPSIWQSLGLNGVFSLLLIPEWIARFNDTEVVAWQALVVLCTTLFVAVFTEATQLYERKRGRPLINTNPIKVGAKWQHRWAKGATSQMDGEYLVALLGPNCPFCQQWVRVGNAIAQSPSLPSVVGVIGDTKQTIERFRSDHGVKFPIAEISPSLMARLADAVPTTVHVVSGRINGIWAGQAPPEFVHRFKLAFFPTSGGTDEQFFSTTDHPTLPTRVGET
jgi:hypothetical protein